MSEKEEESQSETEETVEEQKVWRCQECGKELTIPPEFSDEELKEIEEKGELVCYNCQQRKEEEEKQKLVFKGELEIRKETWKPLLKYAKRLLEEATFRVNGDTVTLCEMDDSRVAMLKAVVRREGLEDYVEEKQPDKLFRVDLATFSNAIRQAGYPATVKSDGAYLHFENSWGNYRMPLLLFDTEKPPQPKIEYTAHATLDISEIFDKLKWIHDKPDGVTLIAKDGKLRVRAGNGVGERLEAEIGECKGEAKACYSLEYLKVLKERYSSEGWDIEFATEMPLHAQKTKRVGERDSLQLDFWLAPRIEAI